jgi:hypothetical protein
MEILKYMYVEKVFSDFLLFLWLVYMIGKGRNEIFLLYIITHFNIYVK